MIWQREPMRHWPKLALKRMRRRLKSLRAKALRNIIALEAAGRGVRAARRRLTEIIRARAGVQTYDIEGKTHKIGGPVGTLKTRL